MAERARGQFGAADDGPETTPLADADAILERSRAARERSAERVGPGADDRVDRERDEALMREELGEN